MFVYRIVKLSDRATDISGLGAFKFGGRWNSKGTYMLYTSMNSSLAYLENLVHFDESDIPPNLFITKIEIKDEELVFNLPDKNYPEGWQEQDNLSNKLVGDEWMRSKKYLAIKVRSAINPSEYNFLINPLFTGFNDLVKVVSVNPIVVDARLIR